MQNDRNGFPDFEAGSVTATHLWHLDFDEDPLPDGHRILRRLERVDGMSVFLDHSWGRRVACLFEFETAFAREGAAE
jgi:hypothetical protein